MEYALDATTASSCAVGRIRASRDAVEALIDGVEALPQIAEELSRDDVHMTGWFISPDLKLTREEEPVSSNLLAQLA